MYGLGLLLLVAVALAVRDRRKRRGLSVDPGPDPARSSERAAYTEAERIRGEANITHPPHGGGMF